MSVIYILIPIAILLSALGIYLFFWAVKTDQFEDLEKQGLSILFDDDDNQKNKQEVQTLTETNDTIKIPLPSSEISNAKTESSEKSNTVVKDGD